MQHGGSGRLSHAVSPDECRLGGSLMCPGVAFSGKETEVTLSRWCPITDGGAWTPDPGLRFSDHSLLAKLVFFPTFLIQSHL